MSLFLGSHYKRLHQPHPLWFFSYLMCAQGRRAQVQEKLSEASKEAPTSKQLFHPHNFLLLFVAEVCEKEDPSFVRGPLCTLRNVQPTNKRRKLHESYCQHRSPIVLPTSFQSGSIFPISNLQASLFRSESTILPSS